MPAVAIDSRKNVSEMAEASVANLMRIALEPKKIDAMNRTAGPVELSELRRILDQIYFLAVDDQLPFHRCTAF
jgi:hypothetical protein